MNEDEDFQGIVPYNRGYLDQYAGPGRDLAGFGGAAGSPGELLMLRAMTQFERIASVAAAEYDELALDFITPSGSIHMRATRRDSGIMIPCPYCKEQHEVPETVGRYRLACGTHTKRWSSEGLPFRAIVRRTRRGLRVRVTKDY